MSKVYPILLFKVLRINAYLSGSVAAVLIAYLIGGLWGAVIGGAIGGWCMFGVRQWKELFLIGQQNDTKFISISSFEINGDESDRSEG